MSKQIELLTPQQVKDQHPLIYAILFNKEATRLNESLHDKFIRLNLKCWCATCRNTKLL